MLVIAATLPSVWRSTNGFGLSVPPIRISIHAPGGGDGRQHNTKRLTGSSPRVRGTRQGYKRNAMTGRFIPASAGNSHFSVPPPNNRPVHPRECGELKLTLDLPGDRAGSSPRVRGTPIFLFLRRTIDRFIPASAGNSSRAVYDGF